jgi:hypothetical protein
VSGSTVCFRAFLLAACFPSSGFVASRKVNTSQWLARPRLGAEVTAANAGGPSGRQVTISARGGRF